MHKSMSRLLRERLGEPEVLIQPGAFNAISARIIEDAGFQVMGVSTYSISASLLGKPDVGLVTLEEIVRVTRYIVAAVGVPVLADAGTGYGNAINAIRTCEDFIRSGAAGLFMLDQAADGHPISGPEAGGKFAAMAHVRDELDPDFLVIARCSARSDLDELIARASAYVEAGADIISPVGLTGAGDFARLSQAINVPLHAERADLPAALTLAQAQNMGLAILGDATGAINAAAQQMSDYLRDFAAEDVDFALRFLDQVKDHPTGNMHAFAGFPKIRELEEKFLPGEDVVARYENSLGYKP